MTSVRQGGKELGLSHRRAVVCGIDRGAGRRDINRRRARLESVSFIDRDHKCEGSGIDRSGGSLDTRAVVVSVATVLDLDRVGYDRALGCIEDSPNMNPLSLGKCRRWSARTYAGYRYVARPARP